jgi:hypothetical protein
LRRGENGFLLSGVVDFTQAELIALFDKVKR